MAKQQEAAVPMQTSGTDGGSWTLAPGSGDDSMSNVATAGSTANWSASGAPHGNKKFFPKKPGGIGKTFKPLPNSIKKKRFNFRLRKLITPKAPVMVLNEMVGSVTYTFREPPAMAVPNMALNIFWAQCEVEGHTFTGSGPSKQVAKNICAEQAIQAVVAKKCLESREKIAQQLGQTDQSKYSIEDETPWAQLASLALFKLFNDWQNQGFQIPSELLRAPDATTPPVVPQEAAAVPPAGRVPQHPAKKLPDNPTARHPVQLLNELRGGVVFNVIGESGSPPNTIFTMGIELDGKLYQGEGRNKKDAKKNCALAVLKEVYNIVYPVGMDTSS